MRNLIFDLYRVLLLFWKSAKWLLPYLLARVFYVEQRKEAFGVRLRSMIEEMGATYVKLGQYLAIRYDIFAPETCNELSKLMNEVPPVSFELARGRIERELGGPLRDFFADFDPVPVAAASIAQVHRARARDGMSLAVKVKRPGVERTLRADLRTLSRLVKFAGALNLFGDLPLEKVVDELTASTLREIDFLTEGRTAARIGRESPPFVHVPEIRWDLTTRGVLSMEFIEGVSLLEVCQLAESGHPDAFDKLLPGISPPELASELATACLIQAYVYGHFHGDPHPANILIRPDGKIVFVDFGIFGELSKGQRDLLSQFAILLAQGRLQEAFGHYEALVIYGPNSDFERFRDETLTVLQRWYATSSSSHASIEEKIGVKYQIEMLGVMSRCRVGMQTDQLLFWRSQAVLDATAHRLPVEFDMLETISEFFKSRQPPLGGLLEHLRTENLTTQAVNLVTLAHNAPSRVESLLAELADRRFTLRVRNTRSEGDERLPNVRVKLLSLLILLVGVARLWLSELAPALGGGAAAAAVFPVCLLALALRMLFLWRRLA